MWYLYEYFYRYPKMKGWGTTKENHILYIQSMYGGRPYSNILKVKWGSLFKEEQKTTMTRLGNGWLLHEDLHNFSKYDYSIIKMPKIKKFFWRMWQHRSQVCISIHTNVIPPITLSGMQVGARITWRGKKPQLAILLAAHGLTFSTFACLTVGG